MRTLLGVTGSIACGKSTICNRLRECTLQMGHQAHWVDADVIRRQILDRTSKASSLRVQEELVEHFGNEVILPQGGIDRWRLGNIIFSDEAARRCHDSILDPVMIHELSMQIHALSGLIIVESALLVEKKLLPLVHFNTLVVDCAFDEQIRRLSGGDLPTSQIQGRMNVQYKNYRKIAEIKTLQALYGGRCFHLITDKDPPQKAIVSIVRSLLTPLTHHTERTCVE